MISNVQKKKNKIKVFFVKKNLFFLKNFWFFRFYVCHIKKAEAGASAKTLPGHQYLCFHNIDKVLVSCFHSASWQTHQSSQTGNTCLSSYGWTRLQ